MPITDNITRLDGNAPDLDKDNMVDDFEKLLANFTNAELAQLETKGLFVVTNGKITDLDRTKIEAIPGLANIFEGNQIDENEKKILLSGGGSAGSATNKTGGPIPKAPDTKTNLPVSRHFNDTGEFEYVEHTEAEVITMIKARGGSDEEAAAVAPLLIEAAQDANIDVALLVVLAQHESSFKITAVSTDGRADQSLIQVGSAEAQSMGIDNSNPRNATIAGARYLAWLMNSMKSRYPDATGDKLLEYAFKGYNGGPNNNPPKINPANQQGDGYWQNMIKEYNELMGESPDE